jgi:DNA-binding beta-propeller fold protein YncE
MKARVSLTKGAAGLAFALCMGVTATVSQAQNHAPNPYETIEGWAKMPAGREWGSTSAVFPAPDGKHIWVAERCGANSCVGSDLDPVLLFDEEGKLVRSFGAGLITWPHGINVDRDGNVWVADGVGYRAVPEGVGHVVHKFSPEGELLMTLGRAGQPGDGEHTLRKPSDVLVAPNGNIFVVDSHDASERPVLNSRVVKYDPEGRYITSWGAFGTDAGEFKYPHALAMDSEGRLFVGDRYNNRIQIFTQEGQHLGASKRRASSATIIGVPHIYAETDADAVFGLLYAQAEDDFPRVERNYYWAIGRLAEAEGEEALFSDLRARLYMTTEEARAAYEAPDWLQALCDAFADGLNYYLATHPRGAAEGHRALRALDAHVLLRGLHRRRHRADSPGRHPPRSTVASPPRQPRPFP